MITSSIPDRTEASEYYFKYIGLVGSGDIRDLLETQRDAILTLLEGVSEERSTMRYAPGKWSLRQVLSHVNDTERLFLMRAFWFARGFDSPLPGFDQDVSMAHADADERSWKDHLEEFRGVRAATSTFFRGLPEAAWSRRGIASDNPFTVHALAYIAAGHAEHHLKIVREQYLHLS